MKSPWPRRLKFLVILAMVLYVGAINMQLNERLISERYYNHILDAKEVAPTSRLYMELSAVTRSCGVNKIPQFYIVPAVSFNAFYLSGTRFPYGIRRGKIYISQDLAELLSREGLRFTIAHELGHRSKDIEGPFDTPMNLRLGTRSLTKEESADAFAANCLGKNTAIAAMEELIGVFSNLTDPRLSEKQRDWLIKKHVNGEVKRSVDELKKRIETVKNLKQP